ncbi:hypothetical protein KVT40_009196 [Elsinoe batatas]|uniref:Pel9A-like right handed beta-helix region domain-containing protein n=1 Tax=Elsinoe batatas TaxID=2601811 RepID=A0A8K0KYH4_9PEZI|nr:hypothetical protein KVT40_009196 [Elsinoe batatas]
MLSQRLTPRILAVDTRRKEHPRFDCKMKITCLPPLINGPYGVYSRDSSHNYYELLITHDNYESGFQLQGLASGNTVLYLDSYRNRDPRKNGESADGFACKEGSGEGNVLRNARLWDNVDDGLDLFMFGSPVTIEEVYAWGNGFNLWGFSNFNGDGNGYKLGITGNPPANHIVRNSMAWGNARKGFIDKLLYEHQCDMEAPQGISGPLPIVSRKPRRSRLPRPSHFPPSP